MTRRLRPLILLLMAPLPAALPAPVWAQDGQDSITERDQRPGFVAWNKGLAAERAGKLEDALAAYQTAERDEPQVPEFRERAHIVRFALAQSFTGRAERALLEGNVTDAAALLRRAIAYDPQSGVAQERLRQLQRHAIEETTSIPQYVSASPQLLPQPGKHDITYRGEARGAYLELARLFGLLVVFDEDATRAQIRLRLTGVDFWTAARVLGEQTGTFLRALDGRTFLVVNDTLQKRREYTPQIERTLLLPESDRTDAMNEMVRAVRDIAGLTHTQLDTRTRSLTVRGAEMDVALATALVRQLEQPRGEVMLEIDVLEVDRNLAENLGIVPPSSSQIVTLSQQELRLAQQSTNGLVQVIQELFGTPPAFAGASTQQISTLLATGTTSLGALIPPIVAFGGGQTIWLATLPGATANFASQISAVLSAERILLRAQDGEEATFFVGERFPINFSNLSNALTTSGNTPAIGFGLYAVDQSPRAIISTSLRTGNTNLDLVTANQGSGNISVLLGNGDGTFQASVNYPAGTNPVALAFGVFRAAGQPVDLAVVDQGTNSVQILLGNGDGTFQAPVAYPVGTQPAGIALADYNGDGITDIAVTNQTDNTISLLIGNGDGTFKAATTVALANGQGPVGIVASPFGGPLPTATPTPSCAASRTISAIARTGGNVAATLASPLTLPTGANGGMVTVAGVGESGFDGTFAVVSGSGTNMLTWAQAGPDATSSGGSASVAVLAGASDLAVTNSATNTVTLLFGDGHGDFCSQTAVNTGTLPVAIAAADFNGDGLTDFVVANETDGTVSVFLNTGTPVNGTIPGTAVFTSRTDFTVGNQPDAVITGDFNGDSRQDIVVANSGDNTISVLFGAGDGTFPATAALSVGQSPAGLASGDFNGDGLTDAATANSVGNSVTVVINSQQLTVPNPQTPYPGSQYEDIGVKAKATPRIHSSGDVTLSLNLEFRSITATSFNGIPVLTNRTVEQTVRLRPNESSVLSGIFSDQQSLALTGWPGVTEIPVLGEFTSNRNPQSQQSELVIVVTPRLVRQAPRTRELYYIGYDRQSGAAAGTGHSEPPETLPITPQPAPPLPVAPPGQAPPLQPQQRPQP